MEDSCGVSDSAFEYSTDSISLVTLCANTRCPKCRSRWWDGVVLRCDAYRMQGRILDLHVDSTQAVRRIDGREG